MPRRTDEETSAAGAEAFRGAFVGAAKVYAPHVHIRNCPPFKSYTMIPKLGSTNHRNICSGVSLLVALASSATLCLLSIED